MVRLSEVNQTNTNNMISIYVDYSQLYCDSFPSNTKLQGLV